MDSTAPRTLIADDQPDVLEALRLLLEPEGFRVAVADSPAGVIEQLSAGVFDVLLMDLNYACHTTSGKQGLDLLLRVRKLDTVPAVLVMTAHGSVEKGDILLFQKGDILLFLPLAGPAARAEG